MSHKAMLFSYLVASHAVAVDTMQLQNCRDARECSALIAQSIVQGSQKCWAESYHKTEHHFKDCVSNFCFAKCGHDGPCTQVCEQKGHGVYHKVNAFMQMKITTAMNDPDELAELKQENPGAYAIVKALLTKRALGVLNPEHPNSSLSTTSSSSGKRDWLNWKPADESGIIEEESAKQSLDEPVSAPPAAEQPDQAHPTSNNFLPSQPSPTTMASLPTVEAQAPIAASSVPIEEKKALEAPLAVAQEKAPTKKPSLGSWASIFSATSSHGEQEQKSNPYLDSVNWGVKAPEEKHENPYLTSFEPRESLVAQQDSVYSTYLKDLA